MKNLIIGIIFCLLLQSCDCFAIVNEKIEDSASKLPIENVNFEFVNVKSTNPLIPPNQLIESLFLIPLEILK